MSKKKNFSLDSDEVSALAQLFAALRRGGDTTIILRDPHVRALQQRVELARRGVRT